MRKKFLCLLLVVLLALTLVACVPRGNNDNNSGADGDTKSVNNFKFVNYTFDKNSIENYSKDNLIQYSDKHFKNIALNIKSNQQVSDISSLTEVNNGEINIHSLLLENIEKWESVTSFTAEQTKSKFKETNYNYYLYYTSAAKILLDTKNTANKPLSPLKITHNTDNSVNTEYCDTFKEKDSDKISIVNYIEGTREVYMNILVFKEYDHIYLDGFSYVIENNKAEIKYIKIDKDFSLVIEFDIDLTDNELIFNADRIKTLSINYYNIKLSKGYSFEPIANLNGYVSLQTYANLYAILNSFDFPNYSNHSIKTLEYFKSADLYDITPNLNEFLYAMSEEMRLSNLEYDRIVNG